MKSRKLRRLVLVLLLLVVGLPLVAYLLLTRPFFLKAVVLPRIEQAAGITLRVEDISLSPFSRLELGNATLSAPDKGIRKAKIPGLTARYDLIDILRGTVTVHEVVLRNPEITLVPSERTDAAEEEDEEQTEPSPPRLNIGEIRIEQGALTLEASSHTVTLRDLNLRVPGIRTGESIAPNLDTAFEIAPATPETPPLKGTFHGAFVLGLTPEWTLSNLQAKLDIQVEPRPPYEEPLRFQAQVDADPALEAQRVHIRGLQAHGKLGDMDLLSLDLSEPVTVRWDQPIPRISDTRLKLSVPSVQLADLHLPEAVPVRRGVIDLNAEVEVASSGERLEAHLDFALTDPEGTLGNVDLAGWDVRGGLRMAGSADQFRFPEVRLDLTWNDNPALRLRADGVVDSQLQTGSFRIGVPTADLGQLAHVLPNAPLPKGALSGSASVTLGPGGVWTWNNHLEARDLHWTQSDYTPPSPLKLEAAGSLHPSRLNLDRLDFSWPEENDFANTVHLTGELERPNAEPLRTDLSLRATSLNLTPWKPAPRPAAAPPSEAPRGSVLPESEPTLPELPFQASSLKMKAERVVYRGVEVADIRFHTFLEPTAVRVTPLDFRLNGAHVTAALDLSYPDGIPVYTVNADWDPFDLEPLVSAALPDKEEAIQGVVWGRVALDGRGVTGEHLRRHLRGDLEFHMKEGRIRLMRQGGHPGLLEVKELVRELVEVLAGAIKVPAENLKAPPVTDLVLQAEFAEGRLNLQKAQGMNRELLLAAEGRVDLKANLLESSFERLPIIVGVSTNVAQRARVYREDRVRDDYVVLPSFLKVEGTLGEPSINVDKSVITGLILTGVTQHNQVGGEKVQEILEGLGGLLSGEGPAPKASPTPGPTPRPGVPPTPTPKPSDVERVIEGLRILRDLRATPTPTP